MCSLYLSLALVNYSFGMKGTYLRSRLQNPLINYIERKAALTLGSAFGSHPGVLVRMQSNGSRERVALAAYHY